MCGRFSLYSLKLTPEEFRERFGFPMPDIFQQPFGYNIGPYREIPAIYNSGKDEPDARLMFWQLIPSFAKTFESKYTMFNSRVESLQKQSFRQTLLQRARCVIPGNNFFEWAKRGSSKIPYKFTLKNDALMSFGGIYSIWRDSDGQPHYSCSMITVPANNVVGNIHPRMPFILTKESESTWLDPKISNLDQLFNIIKTYPDAEMAAAEVSTAVNNIRNEGPELLTVKSEK